MMEPLHSINKAYGLVLQQEGQLQGTQRFFLTPQINKVIREIGGHPTIKEEEMQILVEEEVMGFLAEAMQILEEVVGTTMQQNNALIATRVVTQLMNVIQGMDSHPGLSQGKLRPFTILLCLKNSRIILIWFMPSLKILRMEVLQVHKVFNLHLNSCIKSSLPCSNPTSIYGSLSISHLHSSTTGESSSQQQNSYSSNIVSKLATWILDSGATDHVTHDFTLYTSFHFIKPVTVNLPNGVTVNC